MSKYKAEPIVTEDGRFDSKAEYARWCELKLLQKAARINHLERQRRFSLLAPGGKIVGHYVADFTYSEGGRFVVEEVKGVMQPLSRWKLRHFSLQYGIEPRITNMSKRKAA